MTDPAEVVPPLALPSPDRSKPGRARAVAAADAQRSADAFTWLSTAEPAEVLARLADGDPLALEGRVAERARQRWLLVDPSRAVARARAVVARRAAHQRVPRAFEAWLAACIDEALDQLAGERSQPDEGWPLAPAAYTAFHRLPSAVREVFCRVVLEGEPLEELARRRGTNVSALGRDARRAIDALVPPAAGRVAR